MRNDTKIEENSANSDPTQVWNSPDVISGGARFCRENFLRRSFLPRKRPSLGHGFYYYLLLLLFETDYNANLRIVGSADSGRICNISSSHPPSRVAPDEDIYTGDEIWEQMIRQSWLDIVRTINR